MSNEQYGLVLYLNGREIYRWNMPAGALNENTPGLQTLPNNPAFLCITSSVAVTNFSSGTNWFGTAVYPINDGEFDTLFGLEVEAEFYQVRPMLLSNGPPGNLRLGIIQNGTNVVVTWPNSGGNIYYGFALLDAPVHPQPGSPPWRPVSHGTNGAVLPKAPPPSLRLYYLLKGPNSP